MTWIAPDNIHLNAVTGMTGGVGLNPWPTFDWNNLTVWLTPLTIPTFPILNMFVGILIGASEYPSTFLSDTSHVPYHLVQERVEHRIHADQLQQVL